MVFALGSGSESGATRSMGAAEEALLWMLDDVSGVDES